jgi:hypothetical protein
MDAGSRFSRLPQEQEAVTPAPGALVTSASLKHATDRHLTPTSHHGRPVPAKAGSWPTSAVRLRGTWNVAQVSCFRRIAASLNLSTHSRLLKPLSAFIDAEFPSAREEYEGSTAPPSQMSRELCNALFDAHWSDRGGHEALGPTFAELKFMFRISRSMCGYLIPAGNSRFGQRARNACVNAL